MSTRSVIGSWRPYRVMVWGPGWATTIRADRFMLPTHEQVRDSLIARVEDWDGFIERQIADPHIVAYAQQEN